MEAHSGSSNMKNMPWVQLHLRRVSPWSIVFATIGFTLLFVSNAGAQGLSRDELPESLRPWVPWVQSELGTQACATRGDTKVCVWPGLLELSLSAEGGRFRQQVTVGAKSVHALPGQRGAWPQEVKVGGRAWAVLARDGVPVVELPPGVFEIEGRFAWSRIPETLHVGAHSAFVALKISDREIPLVKRDGGNIWLKGLSESGASNAEPELAELAVFRRIRDGIPLQIETLMVFQVSGKARELSFAQPLLPGTVPLSVEGDLAVALESNGALRVQLVPGRHEVRLLARALKNPEELKNVKRAAPWPSQEVWTWHPATELRGVEITGAPGIDASRTALPSDWRQDSAYSIDAEGGIRLSTTRRAQEQVPPNRIALQREFWLDEAAGDFTVRDTLSGTLNQGWRLNLQSGELGQVKVGGDSQVITLDPSGARGVELRDSQLQMLAVSRVKRGAKLSAVGWSEDVDSLQATVHLPPGWDLLAVQGVDAASNTWLSEWDLFSVFYLLLMTLAVAKILGVPAAVIAAIVLLLGHSESDAPQYIWLPLVVGAALLRLLHEGRVRTFVKWGFYATSLVFVLGLASFAVDQVRIALYPHLNAHFPDAHDFAAGAVELEALEEGAAPEAAEAPQAPVQVRSRAMKQLQVMEEQASADAGERKMKGKVGGASSRFGSQNDYRAFKPDAIVQTGPGIPDVSTESWELTWSGPVTRDHEFKLYLLSPALQRFVTFVRLSSMLALAYLLFLAARRRKSGSGSRPSSSGKLGATALVLGSLLSLFSPSLARAEQPSDERLEQLKAKLLQPASCASECISVSSLSLNIAERLSFVSEVSAGARAAYKLPGPASSFSGSQLRVDGKPATAVRLEADGAYYLRLEPGVHRVEFEAELNKDRTTLDLGDAPEFVHVTAEGWTVNGVNELGRAPGGALTLQREAANSTTPSAKSESEIAVPPYFVVTRALNLGVTGEVITSIERLSEPTRSEVLEVALLSGEKVTTPGIEVASGQALISFPRQTSKVEFTSNLALPTNPLEDWKLRLSASTRGQSSEVWKIACGVVWHCEPEGLQATAHQEDGHSAWTYHPWPGEELSIHARQGLPAPGTSLTVQKATLTLTPGVRMSRGELEMLVQTSRATIHHLVIPSNAKLESVEVDGTAQAVRTESGRVGVSLSPGLRRIKLSWQAQGGLTTWFRAPKVEAGAAGVNFRTVLQLPSQRWLLFAWGPSQGPAILMWGYLLLILVGSLILARLPFSPLKGHQWMILGLGLTQVPSAVALVVAGWFFAIASRRRWPRFGYYRHNLLHLGLIGYSFVFLIVLTAAVYQGLVSSPDMEVVGAGSHGHRLIWVSDRSAGSFAPVGAFSLSIWVWRAFMLAWALWLSRSLIVWLRWAWTEMQVGSFWIANPARGRMPEPGSASSSSGTPEATQTPRAPEVEAQEGTTGSEASPTDEEGEKP